jgi:hypothetical protein
MVKEERNSLLTKWKYYLGSKKINQITLSVTKYIQKMHEYLYNILKKLNYTILW